MRKNYYVFALFLFSVLQSGKAQDYSVSLIPEELKQNAYSVIREFSRDYELTGINSGIQKVRKAVTVLSKEGDDNAFLFLRYDKNSVIYIRQIVIYDKNGKKIKSVKQSEVDDSPAYDGSLFSDDRVKSYEPVNGEYPYTVEYIYEIKSKNMISYGSWRPYTNYNISAQNVSMTIKRPKDVLIHKKEINVNPSKTEYLGNIAVDSWEIHNLKAIEEEPFDVSLAERIPCVLLMPDALIYDDYNGSARTWIDFGKWVYSLYKDKSMLGDADANLVADLAANTRDTIEIIKRLYDYLQGHSRYIAVTMGLGGFQPFDAKTVAETGYGDCKALTNYMYSLLKAAGIKSFPALVSSGKYKEKIHRDFPNFSQFDHVILAVPVRKDTIWLECTSQNIPFGFLGSFTDNRDVLLLTENGGKFAHTTGYEKTNIRICKSRAVLSTDGSAKWISETRMEGLQYDNLSGVLNQNHDEQKKFLYSNSALPSLQISDFSIINNKGFSPYAIIKETSISKNYCSFSGKYLIMPLNLINSQKAIQKMIKKRESDVLINRSFTDYDTLCFEIPANIRIETLPAGSTIESKFGSYISTITANGNEIKYTRKLSINEGYYRPEDYPELYEFILSVSKSDNVKTILTIKS
jgi:hypothetical protein